MLITEAQAFIFGPEFVDRVTAIREEIERHVRSFIFAGPESLRPAWAESLERLIADTPAMDPQVPLEICDEAALYFTSGTTGAPKATLLTHRNLEHACYVENRHHNQIHTDNFL